MSQNEALGLGDTPTQRTLNGVSREMCRKHCIKDFKCDAYSFDGNMNDRGTCTVYYDCENVEIDPKRVHSLHRQTATTKCGLGYATLYDPKIAWCDNDILQMYNNSGVKNCVGTWVSQMCEKQLPSYSKRARLNFIRLIHRIKRRVMFKPVK